VLSYRHAFHAGNFADLLKHLVLVRSLRYLTRKEKPLLYLDTHAGAGGYSLASPQAGKTQEFLNGIGRIWDQDDLPEPIADYLGLVRQFNGGGRLKRYPGSPWFARQLLRQQDRMLLYEMHPADYQQLRKTLAKAHRCQVSQEDGFKACLALLPPIERRGLVLIDPPYELKEDYRRVVDTLLGAHRRFATGCYAIWYPVVERARIERLERALIVSGIRKILLLELGIAADRPGHGMTASGMILVNPPWPLAAEMPPVLDYLAKLLGENGEAHSRVVELVGE
jgi:23S rRNA (adenine2030-N6)-methyltransferase